MTSRLIQLAVGLVSTLIFLALALYHVSPSEIGAALARAEPLWIAAAMLVYAANLALRAWRWRLILRPVAAIPQGVVARALLVGYGLNNVMPARLGELFRAEYFKKTYGLSRVWALTSIVVERLLDGLTVVACLGLGLMLGAATRQNAAILFDVLATAAVLFAFVLVLAFCLSGAMAPRVLRRFPGIAAQMEMVRDGFAILRTWRTVEVVVLTALIYVPDALSLWCIVRAVGMKLSAADALVLVGVASLSTLVPSGPAFLGTLQFAYALAIEFAGGARSVGIAAATLAQLCLLLPVALIAAGIVMHGSGTMIYSLLVNQPANDSSADS